MNHAGAFGHPRDVDGALLQTHLLVRGLHHQIGGQNGARGVFEAIGRQARDQRRQRVHDQMLIQLDADHASGRRKNLHGRHVQMLRRGLAAGQRDRSPVRVAQFALPALISTALTSPRDLVRFQRAMRTGAACTRFCVNTAAAEAGASETISARSSFCNFADSRVHGRIAKTRAAASRRLLSQHFVLFQLLPIQKRFGGHSLTAFHLDLQQFEHCPLTAGDQQTLLLRNDLAGLAGSASCATRAFQI